MHRAAGEPATAAGGGRARPRQAAPARPGRPAVRGARRGRRQAPAGRRVPAALRRSRPWHRACPPDRPLRVVDLGCGNAYLTFAAHRYLAGAARRRADARRRRPAGPASRATPGWPPSSAGDRVSFAVGTIDDACWTPPGRRRRARAARLRHRHRRRAGPGRALAAPRSCSRRPCCHHDVQRQLDEARAAGVQPPYAAAALVRHPILRERFADVLTDTLARPAAAPGRLPGRRRRVRRLPAHAAQRADPGLPRRPRRRRTRRRSPPSTPSWPPPGTSARRSRSGSTPGRRRLTVAVVVYVTVEVAVAERPGSATAGAPASRLDASRRLAALLMGSFRGEGETCGCSPGADRRGLRAIGAARGRSGSGGGRGACGAADSDVDRRVLDSRVSESSGLAVSPQHRGVLWTHDDSGNPPLLFALARDGRVAGTLRLRGPETSTGRRWPRSGTPGAEHCSPSATSATTRGPGEHVEVDVVPSRHDSTPRPRPRRRRCCACS